MLLITYNVFVTYYNALEQIIALLSVINIQRALENILQRENFFMVYHLIDHLENFILYKASCFIQNSFTR